MSVQLGPDHGGDILGVHLLVGIVDPHDAIGREVAGHDDQRVSEIDLTPFAIVAEALVENLIEQIHYLGVGFFAFVEEDDGVGALPDRFGEEAAFAVAHVTRRRPDQSGDGVLLGELRHVDGGGEVFVPVQEVSQRQRRLCLSDAARADE
jgi:hypothetical protein